MMKKALLFVAILAVFAAHEFSETTKVNQTAFRAASKDKWAAEMNEQGPAFVLFYQTWCGHCKRFIPIMDEAAEKNPDKKFIAVDCGIAKDFCKAMPVRGYPSIYQIADSEHFHIFEGQRTVEGVEAFIKGGYKDVKSTNFAEIEAEAQKAKEEQAKKVADFQASSPHIARGTSIEELKKTFAKGPVFLFVYAPWCGHCKKFIPTFQELVKNAKPEGAQYFATEDNNLGSNFGMKGFPSLALIRDGQWWRYEGGRTEADVVAYMTEGYKAQAADEEADKARMHGSLDNVWEKLEQSATKQAEQQKKREESAAKKAEAKAKADAEKAKKEAEKAEKKEKKAKKSEKKKDGDILNQIQAAVAPVYEQVIKQIIALGVPKQYASIALMGGLLVGIQILKSLFKGKKTPVDKKKKD